MIDNVSNSYDSEHMMLNVTCLNQLNNFIVMNLHPYR
jgi:hypothetical protein